jgi:hypothetical protein
MTSTQSGSNNLGISGKSLYRGRGKHGVPLSESMQLKTVKYTLMRHSGSVMFDSGKPKHLQHPICWCHRGAVNPSQSIGVKRHAEGKSARLKGVPTCKNVWACPVCSSRVCASRGPEVERAMKAHIANGGYVFLVTRTFPHERDGIPLAEMLRLEGKARTAFRNSKIGRAGKNARVGYICSLEVTKGEKNGWHPHTHELIFAGKDSFGDVTEGERGKLFSRFIDELKAEWYHQLRKVGLADNSQMSNVLAHGLDVRGGQYAAEYVSKFGKDQKWGLSRELTAHPAKMGANRDDGGAHPFQLLAWSAEGDQAARADFLEYVKAFHGKRMLSWSKHLKKTLLNEEEITDEEAADLDQPEEHDIGYITAEDLSVLHSRGLLPNFIGYVAEWCSNPETWQRDIDDYVTWARTVPRNARGDVKVKMWSRSKADESGLKGFSYNDKELENA